MAHTRGQVRHAVSPATGSGLLARAALVVAAAFILGGPAAAQGLQARQAASDTAGATASSAAPADYVIGPHDVLAIVFWRDQELTTEAVVRPDGKISVPLLQDVQAAGYTPDQLTTVLEEAASKYITRPNATVIVKQVNSRNVFILGQVAKPGTYPLTGDTTVLQLIAMAGDVREYAKSKKVVVVRQEDAGERRYPFNYKDVVAGRNTEQNILLKRGDTVIVP